MIDTSIPLETLLDDVQNVLKTNPKRISEMVKDPTVKGQYLVVSKKDWLALWEFHNDAMDLNK